MGEEGKKLKKELEGIIYAYISAKPSTNATISNSLGLYSDRGSKKNYLVYSLLQDNPEIKKESKVYHHIGEVEKLPKGDLYKQAQSVLIGLLGIIVRYIGTRSPGNSEIEKALNIGSPGQWFSWSLLSVLIKQKVVVQVKRRGGYRLNPGHPGVKGQPQIPEENLSRSHFSWKQIEWLESVARRENIKIQHACNGGEFCIPGTRYRADGYCAGTNTIYEFNGTYYHGDPRRYPPGEICKKTGKTFGEMHRKTTEKEKIIRGLGYRLVVMWEADYI